MIVSLTKTKAVPMNPSKIKDDNSKEPRSMLDILDMKIFI